MMIKQADTDYKRDTNQSFDNTFDRSHDLLNASSIIHGDDFSLLMEEKPEDHKDNRLLAIIFVNFHVIATTVVAICFKMGAQVGGVAVGDFLLTRGLIMFAFV